MGAFIDIVEGSAVTGGALKIINFNTPNESRLYESTKQFVAKSNTCWISTPLNLVTLTLMSIEFIGLTPSPIVIFPFWFAIGLLRYVILISFDVIFTFVG